MNRILIALSKEGATVFRNNTGALKDKTGRPVHFGLCPGSSDIIGWTDKGVFIAVEVKLPGNKLTEKQWNFIERAKKSGCKAGWASNTEDALDIINKT